MSRFRLLGDKGDRFEGTLFCEGTPRREPVRGEIEGDSTTPVVRGCFGMPNNLASALHFPSSDWSLFIGPNEMRRVRLTNLSTNSAGPIVVFEAELDVPSESDRSAGVQA